MKKIFVKHSLTGAIATLLFAFTFSSCSKNDDTNNGGGGSTGTAATTFKVTDGPIDDANVTAAFVTISDIKVDGQSVSGFTKTTVNLMAYQNGTTSTIGNFNLAGKQYSNITFVIDANTDASGNAPGSYVVTTGNVKHQLLTSSNNYNVTVSKSFTLTGGASNTLVADFDLRRMIIHQTGGGADQYNFATTAEMQNDIRIMTGSDAGSISGTLTDNITGSTKIIAYVYNKGTFNRATELSAQGASGVYFSNALSSTATTSGGVGVNNYQFNFLATGDYEVYFASYKDTNSDGVWELQGTINSTTSGGLDLANLHVAGNGTLNAVLSVATGVTP